MVILLVNEKNVRREESGKRINGRNVMKK